MSSTTNGVKRSKRNMACEFSTRSVKRSRRNPSPLTETSISAEPRVLPPKWVVHQRQLKGRSLYRGLKQKKVVNGHKVRIDFIVATSTIRGAGRGVFCTSKVAVSEGDKLLPYVREGKGARSEFDRASASAFQLGEAAHGFWDLEGAEYEGILAGLVNDSLEEEGKQYSCYFQWDNPTGMYWAKANHDWEEGTTVELTMSYGIDYWMCNFGALPGIVHREFHEKFLEQIQAKVDAGEHLDYINPFTGLRQLSSIEQAAEEATATAEVSTRHIPTGRPIAAKRKNYRPRDEAGKYIKK